MTDPRAVTEVRGYGLLEAMEVIPSGIRNLIAIFPYHHPRRSGPSLRQRAPRVGRSVGHPSIR